MSQLPQSKVDFRLLVCGREGRRFVRFNFNLKLLGTRRDAGRVRREGTSSRLGGARRVSEGAGRVPELLGVHCIGAVSMEGLDARVVEDGLSDESLP